MRDVGARPPEAIVLLKPAQHAIELAPNRADRMPAERFEIAGAKVEEVSQRPLLDRDRTVHVGFAQGQRRAKKDTHRQQRIVKSDRDVWTAVARAEGVDPAGRIDNCQPAGPDHFGEKSREEGQGRAGGSLGIRGRNICLGLSGHFFAFADIMVSSARSLRRSR